jgi:hypothetical protein
MPVLKFIVLPAMSAVLGALAGIGGGYLLLHLWVLVCR